MIKSIIEAGHHPHNLAFVDNDEKILPNLLDNIGTGTIPPSNQQILNIEEEDLLVEFLQHYRGEFDIALSQLVLHQIEDIQEASDLMSFAYQILKPTGNLFIVNLHPLYLQYLADYEPTKFKINTNNTHELSGKYYFDSGGFSKIYSRNIETQLTMFLKLGFNLFKLAPITTEALSDKKPRYRKLAENEIPMFYLLQIKKS